MAKGLICLSDVEVRGNLVIQLEFKEGFVWKPELIRKLLKCCEEVALVRQIE